MRNRDRVDCVLWWVLGDRYTGRVGINLALNDDPRPSGISVDQSSYKKSLVNFDFIWPAICWHRLLDEIENYPTFLAVRGIPIPTLGNNPSLRAKSIVPRQAPYIFIIFILKQENSTTLHHCQKEFCCAAIFFLRGDFV